jgi:hypothetical protein
MLSRALFGVITCCVLMATEQALAVSTVAKTYDIQNVTELVVGNGGRVFISQGDTESLRVEAEPDIVERVSVDLTANKLTLGITRPGGFNFFQNFHFNSSVVTYRLQLKSLQGLELSGAVHADIGRWAGKSLSVNASGASEIIFNSLNLDMYSLELTGASDAKVKNIIATHVTFILSGAASINIEGKANVLQLNESGASDFHGALFEVAKAEIDLSGASSAELQATALLKAEASGASHLHYKGSPQTTIKSTGASDIRSIK